MHFQITQAAKLALAGVDQKAWELVKADGSVVCRSADVFDTEKEARSDIASAKKSMKGAGRCKVLSPDEAPS